MTTSQDYNIAASAVVFFLVETLVRRDVISRGDTFSLLDAAANRCDGFSTESAKIIRDLEAKIRAGN